MSLFTKKIFSLDIGASAVRALEIEKKGKQPIVKNVGMVALPQGVITKGNILNTEIVTQAVKEVVTQAGITTKNVVFSVDGQQVIIRHVKFPKMKEEELQEALKWEVDQYLPMSSSEAVIDFQITGESMEDGVVQMDVMLVVSHLKVVENYIKIVKDAGLTPLAIDIEPLAIARLLIAHYKFDNNMMPSFQYGNIILIDFGADSTQVTFFHKGHIELNRIIPIGANNFTKTISSSLQIPLEDAEHIKREKGISEEEVIIEKDKQETGPEIPGGFDLKAFREAALGLDEIYNNKGQSKSINIFSEVSPLLEDTMREIRRSVDFYRLQHRNEEIDQILLTGGGALLKGLPELLEESIEIPVSLYKPQNFISFDKELVDMDNIAPRLTQGIGLALREVGK